MLQEKFFCFNKGQSFKKLKAMTVKIECTTLYN